MKTNKQIIEDSRAERMLIKTLMPVVLIFAVFAICTHIYLALILPAKIDKRWLKEQNTVSDSIDIKIREARRILDSLENL